VFARSTSSPEKTRKHGTKVRYVFQTLTFILADSQLASAHFQVMALASRYRGIESGVSHGNCCYWNLPDYAFLDAAC